MVELGKHFAVNIIKYLDLLIVKGRRCGCFNTCYFWDTREKQVSSHTWPRSMTAWCVTDKKLHVHVCGTVCLLVCHHVQKRAGMPWKESRLWGICSHCISIHEPFQSAQCMKLFRREVPRTQPQVLQAVFITSIFLVFMDRMLWRLITPGFLSTGKSNKILFI